MARGWESKSVEAQQDEAMRKRAPVRARSPAELATANRRRTLELARARAMSDLSSASAQAHRETLGQAIAALDRMIAELGS